MWMNGSRSRRSTPANARRTGKPSPSKPDGAVVTERTRRRTVPGAGTGTRGRVVVSSTVTAGMPASLVEVSTNGDSSAADPRCHSPSAPAVRGLRGRAARAGLRAVEPATPARLPQADGLRPVRRGPGRRPLRARRASLRLPRRAAGALARPAGAAAGRPSALLDRAAHGPVVLADLSVIPFDPASVRRVVGVLAPVVGRPARRGARQPAGLPADAVRRRGASAPAAASGRRWPAATATASSSSRSWPAWPRSASTASSA